VLFRSSEDPLALLKSLLAKFHLVPSDSTGPSSAGAVGYLGYDCVRQFEPTVGTPPTDDLNAPDMVFMACEIVLVFDHKARRLKVVFHASTEDIDPGEAYDGAVNRIRSVLDTLSRPISIKPLGVATATTGEIAPRSNTSREEYHAMVAKAKDHIRAGDIFQVVLSQRFEAPFAGTPLDLYRALRFVNPSPYLFCLHLPDGRALVGSSPEVHVRSQDGQIDVRPIAGTRLRGSTAETDEANARELLADPKERAEHVMLVDLARNDVGRIAEFSSVRVTDFMTIERYSHVMHIVSNVVGRLDTKRDAYDVLRSTFPAGTVSGSPKVRAMQIINELENNKRGTYAGAVAFFGFDGNLDSCITLRSVFLQNETAYVQAGAGIVADSTPEGEYNETVNKARGMMRALALASQLAQK
jgi:anthranilate synthase component 1